MRLYIGMMICIFISLNSMAQSQIDIGIKGGLNLTFFKVVEDNFGTNPETEFGYYAGVFTDFNIDEDFSIQPELLYIGINDYKFLNAPIYITYVVAHNFRLLVGPSLNYFFDFFSNKFKVRADISAAYNITPDLDFHMKYTLGFEELTPNGLFIGVGLKL